MERFGCVSQSAAKCECPSRTCPARMNLQIRCQLRNSFNTMTHISPATPPSHDNPLFNETQPLMSEEPSHTSVLNLGTGVMEPVSEVSSTAHHVPETSHFTEAPHIADISHTAHATRAPPHTTTTQRTASFKLANPLTGIDHLQVFAPENSSGVWIFGIGSIQDSTSNIVCTRRFSHFLLLRDALVRQFPGAVVPVLPPKSAKLSLTEALPGVTVSPENPVLQRRHRLLNRFLHAVLHTPLFATSTFLSEFLTLSYDAFEQSKQRMRKDALSIAPVAPSMRLKLKETLFFMFRSSSPLREEFGLSKAAKDMSKEHSRLTAMSSKIMALRDSEKRLASKFDAFAKTIKEESLGEKVADEMSHASQLSSKNFVRASECEEAVIVALYYYSSMCKEVNSRINVVRQLHSHAMYLGEKVRSLQQHCNTLEGELSNERDSTKEAPLKDKLDKKRSQVLSLEAQHSMYQQHFKDAERNFQSTYEVFQKEKRAELPRVLHTFFLYLKDCGVRQAQIFEFLEQSGVETA